MIQYRHRNCDKAFTPATFAYELPPVSYFMDMIVHGEPIINFPFAVTYVHPKDSYSKKVGRKKVLQSLPLPTLSFNCEKIILSFGRVYFNLNLFNTNIVCQISVDFKNSKVRMEWIDFV